MTEKYSFDLKLKVVKEYQEGYLGVRRLAKKHGVSKSVLGRWIQIYEKFGKDGLISSKQTQTYSVQFKLDVLSFIERTGSSETETAFHFGLKNPTLVANWKKAYREGGIEGLSKTKGRKAMSNTSNNKSTKQSTGNEFTAREKLERENELLRLEVAYLKKLKAFQMDPEGYLEKHRQRYHSNSKKNSD